WYKNASLREYISERVKAGKVPTTEELAKTTKVAALNQAAADALAADGTPEKIVAETITELRDELDGQLLTKIKGKKIGDLLNNLNLVKNNQLDFSEILGRDYKKIYPQFAKLNKNQKVKALLNAFSEEERLHWREQVFLEGF